MGKSEGNSENWLVTYSDLVTLLLVFFVLLYTLTPGVEETAFDSFISYFQKSSGFFDDANMSNQNFQTTDNEEMQELMDEQEQRWESFSDFLEEYDLSTEVEIKMMSDGVKITLSDSLTFESGSSELLPKAKMILQKVAETMGDWVEEIEVQGHTDNVPIASDSFYRTNWHLGAARSVSVVQFLQGKAGIEPEHYKASSFGEYRPVAKNNTPDDRRKNRRVEIYLKDRVTQQELNPFMSMNKEVSGS